MVTLTSALALAAAVWVLLGGLDRGLPAVRSAGSAAPGRRWSVPRTGTARRRAEAKVRIAGIEAVAAIAAELASGAPAVVAVTRVARSHGDLLMHTVTAARVGGDVAAALERDGRGRAPVLCDAAIAWRVGAVSGAGLAAALRTLVHAARDAEDVRATLDGHLAAPRATARFVALLPVFGLGFGTLLGADPFEWLLGSPAGLACVGAAVTLTVLGTLWMYRIARRVEELA